MFGVTSNDLGATFRFVFVGAVGVPAAGDELFKVTNAESV
jgi:hypothetical protein